MIVISRNRLQIAMISASIVTRKAIIVGTSNSLIEEKRSTIAFPDNTRVRVIHRNIHHNHYIQNLNLTLVQTKP